MSKTGTKSNIAHRLFLAQNGCCFICGEKMNGFSLNDGLGASRDHVYPRSKISEKVENNVVLAHRDCNSKRGNKEPTEDDVKRARVIYAKIGLRAFVRTGDIDVTLIQKRATGHLGSIMDLLSDWDREALKVLMENLVQQEDATL